MAANESQVLARAILELLDSDEGKLLFAEYRIAAPGSPARGKLAAKLFELAIDRQAQRARGGDSEARYVAKLQRAFPDARTLKDIGEAVLNRMGEEQQARDPLLTREQAYVKTLETRAGREVYGWAHEPDALLPLSKAVAKSSTRARLEQIGYVSWDHCVSELAKKFGDGDFDAGLQYVEKHYPTLWAEFEFERYGTS